MSRANKTRYIKWHGTCKCKYRFDTSVCINKRRWNNDKCRCECKEIINKGMCNKRFLWNLSNCECECDKSCDIGEYLDYQNCKYRLVDRLAEECSENIDGNKMIYNATLNDYENSCTVYIVLEVIFFIISISIGSAFNYFHWYLKRRFIETTIFQIYE